MDKYNRVVRELQEMIEISKSAAKKSIGLSDKLQHQVLTKRLQAALSNVRSCYFDYENADNLTNK